MQDEFGFENGQTLASIEIPVEFRSLFDAIVEVAPTLHSLVEWDAACFASLIVLQLLHINPGETTIFEQSCKRRLFIEGEDCSMFANQANINRLNSTYINALKVGIHKVDVICTRLCFELRIIAATLLLLYNPQNCPKSLTKYLVLFHFVDLAQTACIRQ